MRRCRSALSAALLALVALSQYASAWTTQSGCSDVIVGESGPYGADVVPGAVPRVLKRADQTSDWRAAGPLSQVSMYFSWKAGCLEGIRATYGASAGESVMIGQDTKLSTQVLKLGDLERVTKIDFRQDPGKCVEFIRLTTDQGQSLMLGNTRSVARRQAVSAPPGAWLAAFRGEQGVNGTTTGTQVQGRLQNFLLVWAKEECGAPAPGSSPAATPQQPAAAPWAACPAVPGRCEPAPPAANATGVDAAAGKCRWPFCKLNGLGTDMLALDLLCYGRNNGPFGGLNKCRNLACRLAVPGCQSGPIHGHCIGSVEATSSELDPSAMAIVGRPCLEVINYPASFTNMPLNSAGMPVPLGEYVGSLWTPCDCGGNSNPSPALAALPSLELTPELLGPKASLFSALASGKAAAEGSGECRGPLCALLAQLPALNVTLGELRLPLALTANLSALARPVLLPGAAPLGSGLVPAIKLPEKLPEISLTLPWLPSFDEVAAAFAGATAKLEPALSKLLRDSDSSDSDAAMPTAATTTAVANETQSSRRWKPTNRSDLAGVVAALLPRLRFERPDLDVSILGWGGGRGAAAAAEPPAMMALPKQSATAAVAPGNSSSKAASNSSSTAAAAAADKDDDKNDLLDLLQRLLPRMPELPDSLSLTLPGFLVPNNKVNNNNNSMPGLGLGMHTLSMPSLPKLGGGGSGGGSSSN